MKEVRPWQEPRHAGLPVDVRPDDRPHMPWKSVAADALDHIRDEDVMGAAAKRRVSELEVGGSATDPRIEPQCASSGRSQNVALAEPEDLVIVTAGIPTLRRGTTNMIKVHRVGASLQPPTKGRSI